MHEIHGHDQVIAVADTGAMIARWLCHGVDVFPPLVEVRIGEEMKQRGGAFFCFPNFGAVGMFGLHKHGTLRNRKPDEMSGNGCMFIGTDLLGAGCTEECRVWVTARAEPMGFRYSLLARLSGTTSKNAFVNAGVHPYFRTPKGEATVVLPWNREFIVRGRKTGPRYEPAGRHATISIPGLGTVRMCMEGNAWTEAKEPKIVFWRDSLEYLCVEPVQGRPEVYGDRTCSRLTNEFFELTCRFQFTPE